MPPKVKVNVISEPSDDLLGCSPSEHDVRHENATYDAIVEASNVTQARRRRAAATR